MLNALELTKKLIKLNTTNPPGNEKIIADYISPIFKEAGFDVLEHIFDDNRSGLIISLKGQDNSRPPLAFTGHFDTVPLGHIPWQHEPFIAHSEGDKLFGRGSSDMKSGVAAFLAATYNHKDILQKKHGVICILTACEELACQGAKKMARDGILPAHMGPLIIAEPTGNHIHNGHKGVFWIRVTFQGIAAHGSMPHEGKNAIEDAMDFVGKLKTYLREIPHHPDFGGISLNIGTIKGGSGINLVADNCQMELDMRLTPHLSPLQIETAIGDLLQDYTAHFEILDAGNCVYTPKDNPYLAAFAQSAQTAGGEGKIHKPLTFFTDGSPLLSACHATAAFICGPGEAAQCHKLDEYAHISKIEKAYDIYSQFIKDYGHINESTSAGKSA